MCGTRENDNSRSLMAKCLDLDAGRKTNGRFVGLYLITLLSNIEIAQTHKCFSTL